MFIKSPMLIVFEGIDGSGKTTLSKKLFSYLKKKKYNTVWFREPSDSKWGKKIRDLAQSKDSIPLEQELNYFIENRKINVKINIKPALKNNKIVILDRYYFSTACYQGARGMNIENIIKINKEFASEPDIIFVIDVDVKTALSRIKKNRRSKAKLFEKKKFLEKVRKNYLNLNNKNIQLIDGNNDLNTVFKDIRNSIIIKP